MRDDPDFRLIREYLTTGDKSADAPLAALSRIEARFEDAESDSLRLHKDKIDLMTKYVWLAK